MRKLYLWEDDPCGDPQRGPLTHISPQATPPADTDQVVHQLWRHSSVSRDASGWFYSSQASRLCLSGASFSGLSWSKTENQKPHQWWGWQMLSNQTQRNGDSWQCSCEDRSAPTWCFQQREQEVWTLGVSRKPAGKSSAGELLHQPAPFRWSHCGKALTTTKAVFTACCLSST